MIPRDVASAVLQLEPFYKMVSISVLESICEPFDFPPGMMLKP